MAWTNILCKNSTHVYMRPSASESLSFPLSDRILPTGPALDMRPAGPKITLHFPCLGSILNSKSHTWILPHTPCHCNSISLLPHYGDFLFGVSGCLGLTHGISCLGGSFYLCLMNNVFQTFLSSKLLQALLHTSMPSRMGIPALQHS